MWINLDNVRCLCWVSAVRGWLHGCVSTKLHVAGTVSTCTIVSVVWGYYGSELGNYFEVRSRELGVIGDIYTVSHSVCISVTASIFMRRVWCELASSTGKCQYTRICFLGLRMCVQCWHRAGEWGLYLVHKRVYTNVWTHSNWECTDPNRVKWVLARISRRLAFSGSFNIVHVPNLNFDFLALVD